ncbi:MAG: hypothetical protein EB112_01240 [Actinobacteria bacterium]|nr:hypothetical protein [Actinomycetota bacterium]
MLRFDFLPLGEVIVTKGSCEFLSALSGRRSKIRYSSFSASPSRSANRKYLRSPDLVKFAVTAKEMLPSTKTGLASIRADSEVRNTGW